VNLFQTELKKQCIQKLTRFAQAFVDKVTLRNYAATAIRWHFEFANLLKQKFASPVHRKANNHRHHRFGTFVTAKGINRGQDEH
jgi:hypothetical protein